MNNNDYNNAIAKIKATLESKPYIIVNNTFYDHLLKIMKHCRSKYRKGFTQKELDQITYDTNCLIEIICTHEFDDTYDKYDDIIDELNAVVLEHIQNRLTEEIYDNYHKSTDFNDDHWSTIDKDIINIVYVDHPFFSLNPIMTTVTLTCEGDCHNLNDIETLKQTIASNYPIDAWEWQKPLITGQHFTMQGVSTISQTLAATLKSIDTDDLSTNIDNLNITVRTNND